MSKAAISILQNNATITALLDDGANSVVALNEAQGEGKPFIILRSFIRTPNTTFSGQSLDEVQLDVVVVAERMYSDGTDNGAYDISEEVRNALHDQSGTWDGETIYKIVFESDDPPYKTEDANYKAVEIHQTFTIWKAPASSSTVGQQVAAILLTQAQYDALGSYDANTYYLIDGS